MTQRPKRARRAVDGVLLLDKPVGFTSNGALQRVKRLYGAAKAGHTGSLDPLASGLLPLCFGEATKMSGWLLDANKEYRVGCRFGARTTTGDADGDVIETLPPPAKDATALERALDGLRGEIDQVPPMYSALKQGGQRLYELARAGKEVERPARRVTIFEFEPLGWDDDTLLGLRVRCSKGTYVRTLVEDLGRALGSCAHVAWLRRTAADPYVLDARCHTLDALERLHADGGEAALDGLLLPVDSAVADWPRVDLGPDAAHYIKQGQPVMVARAPLDRMLRLYGPGDAFLGVGAVGDDGQVAPKRLIKTN
ncbi:MAG: tRNA pseudouridine(55) synthase TruB [Xanthomonadaceae bacterium]|nr:tRNA pseudouridine(55) synthase TruB [Xanthomonadaceae bacterium]